MNYTIPTFSFFFEAISILESNCDTNFKLHATISILYYQPSWIEHNSISHISNLNISKITEIYDTPFVTPLLDLQSDEIFYIQIQLDQHNKIQGNK